MKKRLSAEKRRAQLCEVGYRLAKKIGVWKLTQYNVSDAAGVSRSTLIYHFNSMPEFRRAVLQLANKKQCGVVMAQAPYLD